MPRMKIHYINPPPITKTRKRQEKTRKQEIKKILKLHPNRSPEFHKKFRNFFMTTNPNLNIDMKHFITQPKSNLENSKTLIAKANVRQLEEANYEAQILKLMFPTSDEPRQSFTNIDPQLALNLGRRPINRGNTIVRSMTPLEERLRIYAENQEFKKQEHLRNLKLVRRHSSSNPLESYRGFQNYKTSTDQPRLTEIDYITRNLKYSNLKPTREMNPDNYREFSVNNVNSVTNYVPFNRNSSLMSSAAGGGNYYKLKNKKTIKLYKTNKHKTNKLKIRI